MFKRKKVGDYFENKSKYLILSTDTLKSEQKNRPHFLTLLAPPLSHTLASNAILFLDSEIVGDH